MMKGKKNVCLLCAAMLLSGILNVGCGVSDKALVLTADRSNTESEAEQSAAQQETAAAADTKAERQEETIWVHVCGAVKQPKVVELPAGSRAVDALKAAGGFREDAGQEYVNLAAELTDGQQLYFPTAAEAEKMQQEAEAAGNTALININTAGKELLCTLTGIGEARAEAIIAYREAHGSFQTKEDIMKVSGIKQSAYEKICDYITAGE